MATPNEEYLDALVRHQIFLLRLSGRTRNKIYEILDQTERRIANRVRNQSDHTLEGVAALFAILSAIRLRAWEKVDEVWLTNYIELALQEPRFQQAVLSAVSTKFTSKGLPTQAQLKTLLRNVTFEGKTLKEWMKQAKQTDLDRIHAELVVGASQREAPATVARRIVGTARANGTDGATQRNRWTLATILATGAVAISDGARRLFYEQSAASFIGKELWVSVLDNRTTPICRSLDGKTFPVGAGPHPPIHFRCRSIRMAIPLGGGSFPKRPTYQQWLSRQPKSFQDEVLGPTRARLFREGGLTLDNFVDRRGWDNIPLRELVEKEREAFIAAGLDPSAF